MSRNTVLIFVCCLALVLAGCSPAKNSLSAGELAIELTPEPAGLTIHGNGFVLASGWSEPLLVPEGTQARVWTHAGRETGALVLAGIDGDCVADTFTTPGLSLLREVWTSGDGAAMAIRLTLANTSEREIRLRELNPLNCDSAGLSFNGGGISGWNIFTQQRLKNGKPGTFKLDTLLVLDSDPFLLIDGGGGRKLLLGFISQDYHLAGIRLRGGGANQSLESLDAVCEFDGVAVAPGDKRSSQWCIVTSGADENELVAGFAELMARYQNISQPPANAPSVFCSWYYWGPWFSESDLEGQLRRMAEARVPFDVFLIDDCWSWHWGDWFPNDKWDSGMKHAAAAIHKAGYRAGIWTCPTLANENSAVATEHPEWLLRLDDGSRLEFEMDGTNYVLDPTYPGVLEHLEGIYSRLVHDWGYDYLKLDFMRSVFVNPRVRFQDPSVTRLEAYRMALEAVRSGAGPDTYISVCGGHFGASLGIADSQRSGSDVVGFWRNIVPYKQNVLRTWMSRMWHVDADAMMVRREEEPRTGEGHGILNVGRLSDTEARTAAINQYLCGDMVTFCEDFRRLDPDRRALYRHVIPSVNSAAVPLDLLAMPLPSRFLTRVMPLGEGLEPWHTLTLVNWSDEPQVAVARLDSNVISGLESEAYLVYDFFGKTTLGLYSAGAEIDLGSLEPHQSVLLRIAPWNGDDPVLAGTDLHFSGGGVEIGAWQAGGNSVSGILNTGWDYPVTITAAFPADSGYETRTITLQPGEIKFEIGL